MSSNTENNNHSESFFSKKYLVISISLSLITMAAVIYWTYTPGVLNHLAPKRLPGLILAIIVSLLRVWFSAAKIRYLASNTLSWMAAVRIVLAWDFTSAVTPSTIGGAPMATLVMTRENMKLGDAGAITLYSVFLDQLWFSIAVPILLISSIFFEVVPAEAGFVGDLSMALIYTGLISYAGLLAYGVLVNPSAIKKVLNKIFKLPLLLRFGEKMEVEAENLEKYAHQLKKKPSSFLMKAFFLSTMSWLMRIALPTIVILSLLPADEMLSILRSLAMNLAFLVVPTPGGSGGVEGLFVVFQGPLIEREGFIGLAVFLWRIISYYISIGLGMMATTWYLNRKMVEVQAKS